jgi:hypothetical protein
MRDFKGMKRQRGRNRNGGGGSGSGGGKPQQNANRAFDSNGPENMKVRGHAQHVFEKYQQLARDAAGAGDRVLAENFLQHAEHYFRLLRTIQPNRPISEFIARDNFASGYDIDFEDESGAQALPDEQPNDGQSEGEGSSGEGQQGRGDYQARDNQARDNQGRDNQGGGQYRDPQARDGQYRDGQNRDGQSRDGQARDGQNRDRWENRQGQGRNNRFDRPRDGQNRDGQNRDGQNRDGQSRDGQARDGQAREERPYRAEGDQRPPRQDRPDRNSDRSYEPRAERPERGDPLAVVQPQFEPLTPQAAPAPSSDERAGMLRSRDGEVSHAPAFLQAAAPVSATAGEEPPAKRPRGRPRKVAAPADEG